MIYKLYLSKAIIKKYSMLKYWNFSLSGNKTSRPTEGPGQCSKARKREKCFKGISRKLRTSLVTQWLRIHLPVQGTPVRALVQEDPACHGATKPVGHNYWACALEPMSHNYWPRAPQLLKLARLEPVLCNKRNYRNEKPTHHNKEWPPLVATRESPRTAMQPKTNKEINLFFKKKIK